MAPSDFVWLCAEQMLIIDCDHRRSELDTLVIHLHLKARAHTHMLGTCVWSVAGASRTFTLT